jgi:hypothetical protein
MFDMKINGVAINVPIMKDYGLRLTNVKRKRLGGNNMEFMEGKYGSVPLSTSVGVTAFEIEIEFKLFITEGVTSVLTDAESFALSIQRLISRNGTASVGFTDTDAVWNVVWKDHDIETNKTYATITMVLFCYDGISRLVDKFKSVPNTQGIISLSAGTIYAVNKWVAPKPLTVYSEATGEYDRLEVTVVDTGNPEYLRGNIWTRTTIIKNFDGSATFENLSKILIESELRNIRFNGIVNMGILDITSPFPYVTRYTTAISVRLLGSTGLTVPMSANSYIEAGLDAIN